MRKIDADEIFPWYVETFKGKIAPNEPRFSMLDILSNLDNIPTIEDERWAQEIREAYDRAVKNPYIRKPLSRALYEVWHRYDASEVERR